MKSKTIQTPPINRDRASSFCYHNPNNPHKQSHCSLEPNDDHEVLQRLTTASFLCLTFLLVEIIGGYLSSSLAVLSDAAHLFSDLASFVVAIIAGRMARMPPNPRNTYGYRRAEALAALFSMCSLAVVSVMLLVEGVQRAVEFWRIEMEREEEEEENRVGDDVRVNGRIMTYTAAVGVVVNVCLAFVLGEHHHHHHSMGGGHDHSHDHGHGGHGDHGDHGEEEEGHGSVSHCNGHSNGHHNGHDHNHDHNHTKIDPIHTSENDNCDSSHNHQHHEHENEHCTSNGHSHHGEDSPLVHSDHNHNHQHTNNSNHDYGGITPNDHKATDSSTIPPPTPPKQERNVNLHAAYLHVIGDLLQSIAVLLSGLVIWYNPRYQLFDPIITILFCLFVLHSTKGVILSSISVLMNDVPPDIDWNEVFDGLMSVKGICRVEDLHIWSISHSVVALSAHVAYDPTVVLSVEEALKQIQGFCRRSGIHHTTIQLLETKVVEGMIDGVV